MDRNKIKRLLFISIGLVLLLFTGWHFVMVIIFGWKWAEWTGFGAYYTPEGDFERGKTLWDVISLLIVPAVITSIAALFTRLEAQRTEMRQSEEKRKQEHLDEVQRQDNEDRFRESELQRYLDRMSELLEKGLIDSGIVSTLQNVARALTLTSLRRLDGERKAIILRFLYETDLITKRKITTKEETTGDTKESEESTSIVVTISPGVPRGLILLVDADFSSINAPKISISSSHLSGANFQQANFPNASLSGSLLKSVNFQEANLESASLSRCDLTEANMSDSNLKNAKFYGADLTDAQLINADLSGVVFEDTIIKRTNFCGANLTDVTGLDDTWLYSIMIDSQTKISPKLRLLWEIVRNKVEDRDLHAVDLSEVQIGSDQHKTRWVNLEECNLDNANFAYSMLIQVRLLHSTCRKANFRGAFFSSVVFYRADLTGADLSEAQLHNSELWRAYLKDTRIDGATIDEKSLLVWRIVNEGASGRDLANADLAATQLHNADLSSAIFCGANLENARLQNTNLANADLTGANLDSADLRGADLRNAVLVDTNLSWATIDQTTVLIPEQIPNWIIQSESDQSTYLIHIDDANDTKDNALPTVK